MIAEKRFRLRKPGGRRLRIRAYERGGVPALPAVPADSTRPLPAPAWQRLIERAQGLPLACFARRYLIQHQAGDLAAGIAFHALLYLFPMFLAVLSIIGLFLQNEDILRDVSGRIYQLFPYDSEGNIQTLLATKRNFGLFGTLSLIGLLWLGSSFIASLARAFNILYGVPPRNLIRQRFVSIGIILLFAVLLVVTVAASLVGNLIVDLSENFLERLRVPLPPPGPLPSLLALGTGLLTAFVLFLVLYWRLPYVRQRFRDIWRGAALAAVLLVAATQIFPFYVRFAPTNGYGAFFSFIFLLTTWLYLVAHITLIGAAINAFRCPRWVSRPSTRKGGGESCAPPAETGQG